MKMMMLMGIFTGSWGMMVILLRNLPNPSWEIFTWAIRLTMVIMLMIMMMIVMVIMMNDQ